MKNLVWGRHLQRLLAAASATQVPARPHLGWFGRKPLWFRGWVAILGAVALVGAVRWIDSALARQSERTARVEEAGGMEPGAEALSACAGGTSETAGPSALQHFSIPGRRPAKHRFQRIEVTAYSSRVSETDSTPRLTATLTPTCAGTIALSRDLLRSFTQGAPFEYGDKILIPGVGIFEVRDTMSERWRRKADIWFDSTQEARQWGRRSVFVTRVTEEAPTIAYRMP